MSSAHAHGHHGPSALNTFFLGPYRFEWMVITFPFRVAWALLSYLGGILWGAIRHPIKTMLELPGKIVRSIPTLIGAWIALYVVVAIFSTARGDKNVLGRVDTVCIYAGHGLWALLADGWQTMDFFVRMLAHDLGAVTGLHGIALLAFAMILPQATILAGIVAACQTMYWWCDYGTVAGAIGTIIGTLCVLAAMAKFAPGMSLGSGGHSKAAGGGGHN